MRKTTKSLLLTSLFLFCAGVILTLGSFIFVKITNVDPYGVEHNPKLIEDKDVSLSEILSLSPSSNYVKKLSLTEFTKLDILNFIGEVNICTTTEETYLSLKNVDVNNLAYEIIGDTLSVKEIDPVGFFGLYFSVDGFSFKGLRQIFGSGITTNSGKVITLYLNENTRLHQITADSKNGNVNLNGVYAESIQITDTNGNISLQSLTCETSKITLTGDRCSVFVTDSQFSILNTSIKFGGITAKLLDGSVQSIVLDTLCGSVDVLTDAPTAHYKLTLSTMVGSIKKNGESLGKEWSASTHTQSRISSTVIVGNITLDYIGGDEAAYVPAVSEPEAEETETTEVETTKTEENETAA